MTCSEQFRLVSQQTPKVTSHMSPLLRIKCESRMQPSAYEISATRAISTPYFRFTILCRTLLKKYSNLRLERASKARTTQKQRRFKVAWNWSRSLRKCLGWLQSVTRHTWNQVPFSRPSWMTLQTSIRLAMKEIWENSTRYSYLGSKMLWKQSRTRSPLTALFKTTWQRPWRLMRCKAHSWPQTVRKTKFTRPFQLKKTGSMKFHPFFTARKLKLNSTLTLWVKRPKCINRAPNFSISYWMSRQNEIFTRPGSKTIEVWLMTTSILLASPE